MGEKDENIKYGFMVDGKCHEISTLPTLDIGEEVNTQDKPVMVGSSYENEMLKGGSASFSCKFDHIKLLSVLLDRHSFIRYCQRTKSNNWLKLHGLPMRRKYIK